jgi:serine/threonine protein kinase
MAVELDELVHSLSNSGLMSADEIDAVINGMPEKERPGDAKQLVREMVRRKKLTKFQAQVAYQGKSRGLVMGNYVILDKLGEGGMGQVYKARHRRMDRIVALKVLPSEAMKQPNAVQRFQQEVKAAAQLTHPNIVTAYDADEAGGVHFLVMEHVEGNDLASLGDETAKIPVGTAVDYIVQAARGLEYAHGKNIIHRDIKPSNLLLDSEGTVKVLDMGLARFNEKAEAEDVTEAEGLTQSGQVMGTLDYMSPEQAQSTKTADEKSDIYSLGCTLFYLLTGKPVYEGETLVAKIIAHRDEPIPYLREVRSDVPKLLDETFRKMVAKSPRLRYESMSRVIAVLEKFATGRGAAGAKPGAASQARSDTVTRPRSTLAASPAPRPVPRSVSVGMRRQDALNHAREQERRKTYRRELEKTVKAADRQHRRALGKGPLAILKKVVDRVIGPIIVLAVLFGVVGGGYVGIKAWRHNSQLINQSEERILREINEVLPKVQMETLSKVHFTNGSSFSSVPETLTFEQPVFQVAGVGSRRGGTLTGEFNRAKGAIKADVEVFDGKDAKGLKFKVDPVE